MIAGPESFVDFHEIPRTRVGELRASVRPRFRNTGYRERLDAVLSGCRHLGRREEGDKLFLSAVFGYLAENEIVDTQPPEFEDLLMHLVEGVGGGWDVIEVSPPTIESLERGRFDEAALRRAYETVDGAPCPEAGAAMLAEIDYLRGVVSAAEPGRIVLAGHPGEVIDVREVARDALRAWRERRR